MAAKGLIDTGGILGILNRQDRWHKLCVGALHDTLLPLMTSEAVLTELFHLVRGTPVGLEETWSFVRSGAIVLATINDSELPELHELMSKYWDRPMDFADATLVHLARRESLTTILTIDRADFETYRIEGKRKFRIIPNGRE